MSASPSSRGGGVDLTTLIITAVASATAAYVTSELWAPGTLASAAITPVIVALVKEALFKPADVVTRVVPVRGVVRSAPPPGEPQEPVAPFHPEDERVAQYGEIHGSSRAHSPRAWKVAVITGLLGFVVAAVIITVPEFVSGKSVLGGDRKTTLFDSDRNSSQRDTTDTTTQTSPTETESGPVEPTVSVPAVETTTVPPPATTTVPPVEATPAPPPATTTPQVPAPAQPVP
ncbi:MAG TPA: hypothetical protein VNA28_01650 [Solirubrobacteraceae bacterium]|nr:hypothetical protein [Solirubrobacteraceae bacterium]